MWQLGAAVTAEEVLQAIEAIKRNKAADDEGLIAEALQQMSPDLWASLIAESFNASFAEGKLSVAERFGILKILYTKGDLRILTNYRPLTITSIIYKVKATVIASRWKKILPAVIAECQHGFVYGRRQFENVMKIRDACAMADMTADAKYYEQHPDSIPAGHQPDLLLGDLTKIEDDLAVYICDRDKAFDRVCHLWLVRALCRLCGCHCEWRPTLEEYLTSSPVVTPDGHAPLPDAVRWIVVLLHDHYRRAIINGQKTDAWRLLCSVFQGCPLAPQLYAVACEFEGRLQIADPRVVGIAPPRPCDLLTDWLADIIAARFADDTQNLTAVKSTNFMLNNNGMWCKGTGGGTQVVKQELTLRLAYFKVVVALL